MKHPRTGVTMSPGRHDNVDNLNGKLMKRLILWFALFGACLFTFSLVEKGLQKWTWSRERILPDGVFDNEAFLAWIQNCELIAAGFTVLLFSLLSSRFSKGLES